MTLVIDRNLQFVDRLRYFAVFRIEALDADFQIVAPSECFHGQPSSPSLRGPIVIAPQKM
jgi:hypothetical protein